MDNHKFLSDEASPSSPARDASFAVVAIALVVGLLAWGHQVDTTAADQAFAQGQQSGVVLGRIEMADTVAEAYAQGRRDAVAAPLAASKRSIRSQPSLLACAGAQP